MADTIIVDFQALDSGSEALAATASKLLDCVDNQLAAALKPMEATWMGHAGASQAADSAKALQNNLVNSAKQLIATINKFSQAVRDAHDNQHTLDTQIASMFGGS